ASPGVPPAVALARVVAAGPERPRRRTLASVAPLGTAAPTRGPRGPSRSPAPRGVPPRPIVGPAPPVRYSPVRYSARRFDTAEHDPARKVSSESSALPLAARATASGACYSSRAAGSASSEIGRAPCRDGVLKVMVSLEYE